MGCRKFQDILFHKPFPDSIVRTGHSGVDHGLAWTRRTKNTKNLLSTAVLNITLPNTAGWPTGIFEPTFSIQRVLFTTRKARALLRSLAGPTRFHLTGRLPESGKTISFIPDTGRRRSTVQAALR